MLSQKEPQQCLPQTETQGCVLLIDLNQIPVISNPIQNDFIYVGSLDKRKGFAEFFELVIKAPFYSYKVVGQPRDKTGYLYYEKSGLPVDSHIEVNTSTNKIILGSLNQSGIRFSLDRHRVQWPATCHQVESLLVFFQIGLGCVASIRQDVHGTTGPSPIRRSP